MFQTLHKKKKCGLILGIISSISVLCFLLKSTCVLNLSDRSKKQTKIKKKKERKKEGRDEGRDKKKWKGKLLFLARDTHGSITNRGMTPHRRFVWDS